MDLSLFLVADYAAVDASGKLNILGVFNTIFAKSFPVRHPSLHLVIALAPELGEYGDTRQLRIIFVDQDGNELGQFASEFEIPEEARGQQPDFKSVIGIQGIEFPDAGIYEFRLFVDKEQKGTATIYLKQIEEGPAE